MVQWYEAVKPVMIYVVHSMSEMGWLMM